MKFKITSIKGKRVSIGYIRGVVFFKHIQFSKHYFRTAEALGVDVKIIDGLIAKNILRVCLIDDESGKRYEAPVERFLHAGWNYPKKGDKQWGKFQPQHFLPIYRWTVKMSDGMVIQQGQKTEEEIAQDKKRAAEKEKKDHDRAVSKIIAVQINLL